MNVRKRLALATVVVALGAGLGTVVPAQAEQTPVLAAASSAPHAQPFAQQAKAAHLTEGQTRALRSEVNRYLKELGGRQVALNVIDLNGNGTVRVAIPGEAHPRDFAAGPKMLASTDNCFDNGQYSGYFCAYEQSGFQGTELQWYKCNVSYDIPFHHGGSWMNNQTKGQRARMYDSNGNVIFTTYAFDSDPSGDWYHVWSVSLC